MSAPDRLVARVRRALPPLSRPGSMTADQVARRAMPRRPDGAGVFADYLAVARRELQRRFGTVA